VLFFFSASSVDFYSILYSMALGCVHRVIKYPVRCDRRSPLSFREMGPLDLVQLTALMDRTSGRAEVSVGLIDGPVLLTHPELASEHIREVPGKLRGTCARSDSIACVHGTFVAGILSARRGSTAPAICPECRLLLRPIFPEAAGLDNVVPSASPQDLAEAIIDTVDAGARIINLSSALSQSSPRGENKLEQALNYAAHHGAIIVAAAGNQGTVGSSAITRHPWVIPVVSCDGKGLPTGESNLGQSIGRRGLRAPGQNIISLGTNGNPLTLNGTSAAAPFVTGTIALLWSEFPAADAAEVILAITRCSRKLPNTLVPPLLDARAAHQAVASTDNGRKMS
jgi:subtilisin family serine protease